MIRSSTLRKNKYILRQFTITKAKQLIFKKKECFNIHEKLKNRVLKTNLATHSAFSAPDTKKVLEKEH